MWFTRLKISQYFPKQYEQFDWDINVKVDLSYNATITDIKNISHIDTSRFALNLNLATLKTQLDKLDIANSVPVPVDLSELINAVNKWCCEKICVW